MIPYSRPKLSDLYTLSQRTIPPPPPGHTIRSWKTNMPALMRVEIQFSNHGMADPRHREPVILFSTTQRVLTWSLHIGGLCTTPFFVERHFCDSHLPMSSHGLDKLVGPQTGNLLRKLEQLLHVPPRILKPMPPFPKCCTLIRRMPSLEHS